MSTVSGDISCCIQVALPIEYNDFRYEKKHILQSMYISELLTLLVNFQYINDNSNDIIITLTPQCSKVRVHPAPCVHDFNTGCTI